MNEANKYRNKYHGQVWQLNLAIKFNKTHREIYKRYIIRLHTFIFIWFVKKRRTDRVKIAMKNFIPSTAQLRNHTRLEIILFYEDKADFANYTNNEFYTKLKPHQRWGISMLKHRILEDFLLSKFKTSRNLWIIWMTKYCPTNNITKWAYHKSRSCNEAVFALQLIRSRKTKDTFVTLVCPVWYVVCRAIFRHSYDSPISRSFDILIEESLHEFYVLA